MADETTRQRSYEIMDSTRCVGESARSHEGTHVLFHWEALDHRIQGVLAALAAATRRAEDAEQLGDRLAALAERVAQDGIAVERQRDALAEALRDIEYRANVLDGTLFSDIGNVVRAALATVPDADARAKERP